MTPTYTSTPPPPVEADGRVYQFSPSQVLENLGPQIPVVIFNAPHIIRSLREEGIEVSEYRCRALIDSGASMCIVSTKIADQLHLHFQRYTDIFMPGVVDKRPTYPAIIEFEWGASYFVPVISCDLVDNFECIIGRDIMANWDMHYNGIGGEITIDDKNTPHAENPENQTDPPQPTNLFISWYIRTMRFFGHMLTKRK
jgi:hypothetical protein